MLTVSEAYTIKNLYAYIATVNGNGFKFDGQGEFYWVCLYRICFYAGLTL